MAVQPTKTNLLALQPLLQIELFIASFLPVTGIFLVLVIGTRWIMPQFLIPFIAFALICAVAIFLAEFALITFMQHAIRGQFSHLIVVCQTYLAGNRQARAIVQGDAELTTTLARTLNSLLDFIAAQERNYISQKTIYETHEGPLKQRVKQFVAEIAPLMNDNLRIQTEKAVGDPGIIIDICGYIAKEFMQYIKLTRSSAKQIINTTREAINSSIDLAQTSETLMLDFSQTTERVEKLVAFMQRLGSMLQLYIDTIQEASPLASATREDDSTLEPLAREAMRENTPFPEDSLLNQSATTVSHSTQSLKETVSALQEQAVAAESVIEEFYNFAQGMHHANTGVLHIVEQISSLAKLAEQWSSSPVVFQLPVDDYPNSLSAHS